MHQQKRINLLINGVEYWKNHSTGGYHEKVQIMDEIESENYQNVHSMVIFKQKTFSSAHFWKKEKKIIRSQNVQSRKKHEEKKKVRTYPNDQSRDNWRKKKMNNLFPKCSLKGHFQGKNQKKVICSQNVHSTDIPKKKKIICSQNVRAMDNCVQSRKNPEKKKEKSHAYPKCSLNEPS